MLIMIVIIIVTIIVIVIIALGDLIRASSVPVPALQVVSGEREFIILIVVIMYMNIYISIYLSISLSIYICNDSNRYTYHIIIVVMTMCYYISMYIMSPRQSPRAHANHTGETEIPPCKPIPSVPLTRPRYKELTRRHRRQHCSSSSTPPQ